MHLHIAIFKWKEGVTPAQVHEALELVRSVRHRVAGIRGIYCGENSSKWAQGFTHGVVVLGETEDAIASYRLDPVHVEAAALIDEMELDGIGIDFVDRIGK